MGARMPATLDGFRTKNLDFGPRVDSDSVNATGNDRSDLLTLDGISLNARESSGRKPFTFHNGGKEHV